VVVVCWIPFGSNVTFLRLLRLMRLLKLVGKVKQLQVIVMGLVKGLSSVTYILLLMFLVFYLYAIIGIMAFRYNDPFHFGGVGTAMITLFRIATLESWTNILYINYFGCDTQYGNAYGVIVF
jgi:voltage-gated sodium channel